MLRNTHVAGCCNLLSRLLASLLPSTTCMQALNPYLSDGAVSAVIEAAQDWQELCVLHDKLQRCALCLPGAAVGTADGEADRTLTRLAADLRNTCAQRLDRKQRPAWLAFQVRACFCRAYRLHRMPLACLKIALINSHVSRCGVLVTGMSSGCTFVLGASQGRSHSTGLEVVSRFEHHQKTFIR